MRRYQKRRTEGPLHENDHEFIQQSHFETYWHHASALLWIARREDPQRQFIRLFPTGGREILAPAKVPIDYEQNPILWKSSNGFARFFGGRLANLDTDKTIFNTPHNNEMRNT